MTIAQIGLLALIFVIVVSVALLLLGVMIPGPIWRRLEQIGIGESSKSALEGQTGQARVGETPSPEWKTRLVAVVRPIGEIALPKEGWDTSSLRLRFIRAGLRDSSVPVLFFAAKIILALLLPALVSLVGIFSSHPVAPIVGMLFILVAAGVGYYLPNAVVDRRIAVRQRELFENFPDALDLLTVCVEAGMGLDTGLMRVGEEIELKSKVLSEELHLVTLELRAGLPRERALRNLALRTGMDEIEALVAMLVQSERFGTSVSGALRVFSDDFRTKRRFRAEEAAAQIPLKLLFPLIFFIFPSLLVVLMGPAMISVVRVLNRMATGG